MSLIIEKIEKERKKEMKEENERKKDEEMKKKCLKWTIHFSNFLEVQFFGGWLR